MCRAYILRERPIRYARALSYIYYNRRRGANFSPLYEAEADEVGEEAEDKADEHEEADDDEILLWMAIHLKEDDKTDSRARKEARHHRTDRYNTRHSESREGDGCRTVGDEAEEGAYKVAEDGYGEYARGERLIADKEHRRIDQDGDGEDEKRHTHRVMECRVDNTSLAMTLIILAQLVTVDLTSVDLEESERQVDCKAYRYSDHSFVKYN